MNKGAAFVVGGTGGLGQAICHRLATQWDGVAIGYRSARKQAEDIAAALPLSPNKALPVACDLTDPASIANAISTATERLGAIGTMVFASGVEIPQPYVSQITEPQWRQVIEVELLGLTRIVAATLPLFRAQKHGNFVIIVSVANYCFPPGDALSSVPKAAMEALGRAIAKEEGRYGIRANMVAPGIIDAGLGAQFLQKLYSPQIWQQQKKRIPLQTFGNANDIANATAFLASLNAKYITGQTLIVDGGFSL